MTIRRALVVLVFAFAQLSTASAQTILQDIFMRPINRHGIQLIDWDGYIANPLIKFYVYPPADSELPGTATLTANGSRLYFDKPSTVSSNGPTKTVTFTSGTNGVPVGLSIFPDRDGAAEDYTLTIVFSGASGPNQTNTVAIHVLDLDLPRTNDFAVTENFDRDVTGVFTNNAMRAMVKQAADDWAYFFTGMNLDQVRAGTEDTYIWSNNFDGGVHITNTAAYTGYLLYAYGTTNAAHRSGGEASFNGKDQSGSGMTLPLHRSGGFESETNGNFNALGWLILTNEADWLATGNLGSETNDFYSIAHHEIGHALIFNEGHPGFGAAKTKGAFTSAAVTNYFGASVLINATDHLDGAIDPESGQGAFGYEYFGRIPRKRWVMTKLDLLCAQEVGYTLRSNSAWARLEFPSNTLPMAGTDVPYNASFTVTGGIPNYAWDIVSGMLPDGITLDTFTGKLTGTPYTSGTFNFTARVRDYHENSSGLSNNFTLTVVASPPPR
ncbi:MAG TPA: Ig domain-containing protein [Verrucomicrobiae bacterium]